jgi:protein O-mannosyl-transferase
MSPVSGSINPKLLQLAVFILCLSLTGVSYFGNAGHQFLHWDDITYVTSNSWVTDPSWPGFKQLFTGFHLLNWHPLTWLSYIPEYFFFGEQASAYKTTNIVLHAINALLVYNLTLLLLSSIAQASTQCLGQYRSAGVIAGALFSVHTQHVESVIWISERKDLLCATFFILSINSYLKQHLYNLKNKSVFVFLYFCLAIMSKSMAVTLPAVLLLLDYFPLGRFKQCTPKKAISIILGEKFHFYLVSMVIVLITLLSQSMDLIEQPSFHQRIIISISAFWHYVLSFFYPVGLSPFYPVESLYTRPVLPTVALMAITVVIVAMASMIWKKISLLFIGYFVVTLVPVIGILKVGEQAYADRYVYLPMVGFYCLFGYVASSFFKLSYRVRTSAISCVIVILLALIYNTHSYKDVWRSDLSLWNYVREKYPDSSTTIYNNLGNSFSEIGEYTQAITSYERGIEIDQKNLKLYSNLAWVHEQTGQTEQVLQVYDRCVENNTEVADAYVMAGDANLKYGRYYNADIYYKYALTLNSNDIYALLGLGKLYLTVGNAQQAIVLLKRIPENSVLAFDVQLLLVQAYLKDDKSQAVHILNQLEQRFGPHRAIDAVRELAN